MNEVLKARYPLSLPVRRGASVETLRARMQYGNKKGRIARRRLGMLAFLPAGGEW